MKTFVAAAVVGLCTAYESAFLEHMHEYGLSYGTKEEFEFRFARYLEAEETVQDLNNKYQDATFAHNKFSTWTDKEMERMRGGENQAYSNANYTTYEETEPNSWPKNSIDWRNKGAVTAVQDQGGCGSCWSFGSTAALECAYKTRHGSLVKMSEQQFVDCDTRSYGCDGGWDWSAYEYLLKGNQHMTESQYPYSGRDRTCKQSSGKFNLSSYDHISQKNPSQMYSALQKGVVSVSIKSDQRDRGFDYYSSGVYAGSCDGHSTDHVVAVVGYGVEHGNEYWLIKNSWGTWWGLKGYAKLAKDSKYGSICVQVYPNRPIA